MNLKETLPPLNELKQLVVECEDCGTEIIHSRKRMLSCGSSTYGILETLIEKHKVETGHCNIAVNVTPYPMPKEVDVNITVNEQ